MAAGLDDLTDYLLAGIALLGVQGAGSKEFYDIIQKYHDESRKDPATSNLFGSNLAPEAVTRSFYEKVWDWVTEHPDIRIFHQQKTHSLSLSEFEALEAEVNANNANAVPSRQAWQPSACAQAATAQLASRPSDTLASLRGSLRERLLDEPCPPTNILNPQAGSDDANLSSSHTTQPQTTSPVTATLSTSATTNAGLETSSADFASPPEVARVQSRLRGPRKVPKGFRIQEPIFDEPPTSLTSPKLFASQNRIWHAVAGHSMDLKKLPAMEFVLLCIIATYGSAGIAQPELVVLSGQDKRSVPKRTDALAQKGYIEKRAHYSTKVHNTNTHTSLCVHKKSVKGNRGIITERTIDEVFGPGANFDGAGFIYLLHKLLKESGGTVPVRELRRRMGVPLHQWTKRPARSCIDRLIRNGMIKHVQVRSRRRGHQERYILCIKSLREPVDEDTITHKPTTDADQSIQRPIEVDDEGDSLIQDLERDLGDKERSTTGGDNQDAVRIPPQWTPDRILSNLIFELLHLTGAEGGDSDLLRDITTGFFWKRPLESYVSRLTDDWQKAQPYHLRHLSIIRDNVQTDKKKSLRYLYRTYDSYKAAFNAGEVFTSSEKLGLPNDVFLDRWGFASVSLRDFHGSGSSSLMITRPEAAPGYRPQRWDNSMKRYKKNSQAQSQSQTAKSVSEATEGVRDNADTVLSTPTRSVQRPRNNGRVTLMTEEERIARGLPPRGRLRIDQENKIRSEKGLPLIRPKERRKGSAVLNAKALLTPDQREAAGLCRHGRLHQALIEELRKRREMSIPVTKGLIEELKRRRENALSLTEPPIFDFDRDGEALPDEDKQSSARNTTDQTDSAAAPDPASTLETTDDTTSERPHSKRPSEGDSVDAQAPAKRARLSPGAAGHGTVHEESAAPDEVPDEEVAHVTTNAPEASVVPAKGKSGPSNAETPNRRKKPRANADTPASSSRPSRKGHSGAAAVASLTDALEPTIPPPDEVLDLTLTAAEMRREEIKARYANRVAPGLYCDPFATRKTSRGRPPKMFLATFKLPRLHELPWFLQDPTAVTALPAINVPALADRASQRRHSATQESQDLGSQLDTAGSEAAVVDSRTEVVDADTDVANHQVQAVDSRTEVVDSQTDVIDPQTEVAVSEIDMVDADTVATDADCTGTAVETTGSGTDVPVTSSAADALAVQSSSAERIRDSSVSNEQLTEVFKSPEARTETMTPRETVVDTVEDLPRHTPSQIVVESCDTSSIPQESLTTNEPVSIEQHESRGKHAAAEHIAPTRNHPPSKVRLAPAGWNAINLPASDQHTSYRSPYSTPAPVQPSLSIFPIEATDDTTGRGTQQPSATPESIASAGRRFSSTNYINGQTPAPSRRKQKPGTLATGVRLAAGSVQYLRTEIIKEMIDLCNGVFPGNGEMSVVLEGMWKERAPRAMACPERSTINSTIRNMLLDSSYNLQRIEFLVQRLGRGPPAKKYLISYKHIPVQSPQVQSVVSMIKASYPRKYFPAEIQQYVNQPQPKAITPAPALEVDTTVDVEDLYPGRQAKRNSRKEEFKRMQKEAALQRRQKKAEETAKRRKIRTRAAKAQLAKKDASADSAPEKRVRLAGLNRTTNPNRGQFSEEAANARNNLGRVTREQSPVLSESGPIDISSDAESSSDEEEESMEEEYMPSESDAIQETPESGTPLGTTLNRPGITLMAPTISFYSSNGTFSTECHLFRDTGGVADDLAKGVAPFQKKGRKRATIVDPATEGPKKRVRRTKQVTSTEENRLYKDTYETSEEEDVRPTRKRGRKRKKSDDPDPPDPTLVERLTGLTGNPNDPDYQPPSKKQKTFPTWSERKANRKIREMPEKELPESTDPVDMFKKLFATLVIASSMSGNEGVVDWNIVTIVYEKDSSFDLEKSKMTWSWLRKNMATQLHEFTESFQSLFLDAYEKGTLDSIDDPTAYDWANLVRWALRHCEYSQPSLPVAREALGDYEIHIASHEILDRPLWYKSLLSSVNRSQRLLKYAYAAPLHQSEKPPTADERLDLKARSWIRANIATPKILYDKNKAHDKLRPLGDPTIERVVSDFTDVGMLRLWKLKRLRPGRNYTFTKAFAKKYRRIHELHDFMAATQFKKTLDSTFASDNPDERTFAMSRAAYDGASMVVLSLVNAGQVKLVPRLPPINSDFKAPLPRLSVWGLSEGDYRARRIDRRRMFWEVDVVPTVDYQFGNPLQPVSVPLALKEDGTCEDWPALPTPPLPGRDDPEALLPIWSSIDGESVTWPWWNRILNLVVQPMMFQPGITATGIYRHCPQHTTEMFEIELVLGWLEAVKAAKRSPYGGYDLLPGFWAVFGDKLIDEEDDDFGRHVKRPPNAKKSAGWRSEYNLRYSTLQQTMMAGADRDTSEGEDEITLNGEANGMQAIQEEITRKPRKQYQVAKKVLKNPGSRRGRKAAARKTKTQAQQAISESQDNSGVQPQLEQHGTVGTPESSIDPALFSGTATPNPAIQDVEMTDADAEGDDLDAEGEPDDDWAMSSSIAGSFHGTPGAEAEATPDAGDAMDTI